MNFASRSIRHAVASFALIALLVFPAFAQSTFLPSSEPEAAAPSGDAAEALNALLTTLKDETARQALITRLEELTVEEPAVTDNAPDDTVPPARRLAEWTGGVATGIYDQAVDLGSDLANLRRIVTDLSAEDRGAVFLSLALLLGTIVATQTTLALIYSTLKRLPQRVAPDTDSLLSLAKRVGAQFGVGFVSVVIAWLVGYILAFFVFGRGGIAPEQSLYLNAFLVVSAFSILFRFVVSPSDKDISFSRLAPSAQAVIFRRVRLVFGVLVYGVFAAVPVVQEWTNFIAAGSLRTVIITIALVLALLAIRRISRAIDVTRTPKLTHPAEEDMGEQVTRTTENIWRSIWPVLAIAYVVGCYIVAVTRPGLMVELVLSGTIYTAVALSITSLAFRLLRNRKALSAPVPAQLERALPGLTSRLTAFLPPMIMVATVAAALIAVGLLLHGWSIVDMGGWISEDAVNATLSSLVRAAFIVLFVLLIWAAVASWIDSRLSLDIPGRNVSARTRTLLALFRNAFTIAIVIFGSMIALSEIGIDIAPLLAGAGVIGLAIGFGAQKLVQDIITGVFIQLENAINEGDVISVAGITGGVEKLTIRSVGIRDLHGVYHIVPFSAVDTVSNYMRKFSYHVAEVGVAYKEKVPKVKEALIEAFDRLSSSDHGADIIAPLEVHGVTALADSSVNVRVRIKTKPGKQFALGRAFTELVKEVMDERGIEIPFPHRQLMLPEGLGARLLPDNDHKPKA